MWRGVLALVAAVVVQEAIAARILMLTPVGVYSHNNFYRAIAENLLDRNHTVTLVTSQRPSHVRPNLREVFMADADLSPHLPNLFTSGRYFILSTVFYTMVNNCYKVLASEEIKKIESEQYDVVIYGTTNAECLLPVVYRLKAPLIAVMPNVLLGTFADMASNPQFSSLTASYVLDLPYPLTFTGRMISATHDFFLSLLNIHFVIPRMERDCQAKGLCPYDVPSLVEMRQNTSLMIVNSVRTLENPILPYTPTVVHAGGIHCRPARPLPQDLEEWAAGSGEAGFIYFSLGSVVKSSDMPEEYRSVLLKVFASLEQRVLWKWDQETMEGLPPNVRLSKWLPQQDVLGDPRLRLFLTHGGLFSLQEATYHGVPVLGFPVYVDQKYNMNQAQREGWGHSLDWHDLSFDSLRHAILKMLGDERMKDEVVCRSRVMRDQPMSPGAWTVYWVEYVIRHRGATHLRCPATQMYWYQLYNVDVWLVVVVMTVAVLLLTSYLAYKILTCLIATCCRRNKIKLE